jgi:hypothetical protein
MDPRAAGDAGALVDLRRGQARIAALEQNVDGRCAYRKLNPGISVMESAQDWVTKNVPGAIDGARDRCILFQG